MPGFSWYEAEGTVAATAMEEGTGEVDQDIRDILDLGMVDTFSVTGSGVPVFTDPDCGGMDRIGEAIIHIIGVIYIQAMET